MNPLQNSYPAGRPVKLVLQDGTEWAGWSFGSELPVAGEVVFNTAMTGYPESITDPSYRGQILVLTYPLIGNYGVPGKEREDGMLKFFESEEIHISGLIVSDYSFNYSHWNADQSLADWLKEFNIPGIYGIDTRSLTKHLREDGAMLGKIVFDKDVPFVDPNKLNLVDQVSTREVKKILSDLIEAEDKKHPLSDERLTELLQEKGYNIARRTVAKYREQLNLPVARMRKEL